MPVDRSVTLDFGLPSGCVMLVTQTMGRIVGRGELIRQLSRHRRSGHRIVFTNGCFDILHAGHIRLLQRARGFGDVLVLGLNSDASVRRLKGEGRPMVPARDRATVLAALACVDYVVAFGEDTPFNLIKSVKPDVLVKGGDYRTDQIVGAGLVSAAGGKVKRVRLLAGRSTSDLLGKIRRL